MTCPGNSGLSKFVEFSKILRNLSMRVILFQEVAFSVKQLRFLGSPLSIRKGLFKESHE